MLTRVQRSFLFLAVAVIGNQSCSNQNDHRQEPSDGQRQVAVRSDTVEPERINPQPRLVLNDVEMRVADATRRNPHLNIFPGVQMPVWLTDVDCETYECICTFSGDPVEYILNDVPDTKVGGTLDRLKRLVLQPMYGKYSITGWHSEIPEARYRFVVEFSPKTQAEVDSVIFLPQGWRSKLQSEAILNIWGEAAIRTDATGLPLEPAIQRIQPIAVQTTRALYLILARDREPPQVDCLLSIHYGGLIFDLTTFHGDKRRLLNEYLAILRQQFSNDPLLASTVTGQIIPPGEIWLRREFKSSKVLGSPYFELSTYVLKWWSTGSDDRQDRTIDATDARLYLQVSQSLTRSVGVHGRYEEPTPAQIARYRAVVTTAVQNAQEVVCTRYRGHPAVVSDRYSSGGNTCVVGR